MLKLRAEKARDLALTEDQDAPAGPLTIDYLHAAEDFYCFTQLMATLVRIDGENQDLINTIKSLFPKEEKPSGQPAN